MSFIDGSYPATLIDSQNLSGDKQTIKEPEAHIYYTDHWLASSILHSYDIYYDDVG